MVIEKLPPLLSSEIAQNKTENKMQKRNITTLPLNSEVFKIENSLAVFFANIS